MSTPDSQKSLLQSVSDAFPHDGELHFRHMFGGIGAYFNGRIFALLSKSGLALKLPEEYREQLLEIGGQIVQFKPDSPVMSKYVFVPQDLLEDEEKFECWARRSVDYVLGLPAPKSRKKT